MTVYTQSIWQKVRHLFIRGYEKIAAQESRVANALRGKLAGFGYALTRIVFFAIKLAVVVFLVWLATWIFVFMLMALAIRFFLFKRTIKQSAQASGSSKDNITQGSRSPRTYDNQGNLID